MLKKIKPIDTRAKLSVAKLSVAKPSVAGVPGRTGVEPVTLAQPAGSSDADAAAGFDPIEFDPSDTTKWYSAGTADKPYAGRIGFITSMSSNFCAGCNRVRLTADGDLKVCLFGSDRLGMRDLLRDGLSDEQLVQHVAAAVRGKKAALGGHRSAEDIASHSESNRPMILIGG